MYRVLWGSEKMVLKVDVAGQPKPQAEATMKEQAKMFSRQIDYNSATGEITNWGKAIGLSEHFIIPVQGGSSGSSIERLPGGDQLGNIDDLKFFKRNLVNALMVPQVVSRLWQATVSTTPTVRLVKSLRRKSLSPVLLTVTRPRLNRASSGCSSWC